MLGEGGERVDLLQRPLDLRSGKHAREIDHQLPLPLPARDSGFRAMAPDMARDRLIGRLPLLLAGQWAMQREVDHQLRRGA
jgi:hypothetical protein